jgi:single-stranded-DNA-specific exonuclease
VEDAWGTAQEVIWWDGAGEPMPDGKFDLAYTVRSNDYRGVRGIQVTWVDARPAALAEVEAKVEAELEVVDYRGAANPGALLKDLQTRAEVVVWCEGENCTQYALRNTQSRTSLAPSSYLAIWTTPPGPAELRAALERVKPQTVYLFGVDPGYGSPSAFLGRLAGLVKHALNVHDGGARISELAAATAAREATVRAGLTWLAARGSIGLTFGDGDEVRVSSGDGDARSDLAQATSRLEALLAETAAYRAYYAAADKDRLLR